VGEKTIFMVMPGDTNPLTGETVDTVAERAVDRLKRVIEVDRKNRTFAGIARASVYVLVATAINAAIFFGLFKGWRYLNRRLTRRMEAETKKIDRKMRGVFNTQIVVKMIQRMVDISAIVVLILITYQWITFCLRRFAHTFKYGDSLRYHGLAALEKIFGGVVGALPDLLVIIGIFILARYLAGLSNTFFIAVKNERIKAPWIHSETAEPTRRIFAALIWAFAFVFAYPYIPGSRTEAFRAVGVFVGLILSLGSTGVVNQMISGFNLMYSRALKAGDYVRINETEGVVLSTGMLSTKIRTNKLEEVTLPNSLIVGTQIKNFTSLHGEKGVILYTSVTIGYNTPWRQVHAMLIQAAEQTPGLRKTPPPFVNQTALSDFYVEYQLNAHLDRPEDRIRVLAALHANIQDVFNEYGVQIMSPHYIDDPKDPAVVSREQWYAAPAKKEDDATDSKQSQ